jgi:hypothetical protein
MIKYEFTLDDRPFKRKLKPITDEVLEPICVLLRNGEHGAAQSEFNELCQKTRGSDKQKIELKNRLMEQAGDIPPRKTGSMALMWGIAAAAGTIRI